MHTATEMPRYKCHKTVHALKIGSITFREDGGAFIVPADPGYLSYSTKPGFKKRTPEWADDDTIKDLGYIVIYQGGYESWSPTKEFREGYSRDTTQNSMCIN